MAYTTNDSMLEIAKGNVQGHSVVNKFGANISSADGTVEDVWDGGGTYSFPATALITSMSQTADQAAMRGATIEIQGLNANWDIVTQTADLNASNTETVVTLGTALIRVFRAKVLANVVGNSPIRIHNAGETQDYAIISTGKNQTLMAIYTVPRNKVAYVTNYYYGYIRDAVKDPDSVNFGLWTADRENNYEFQIKNERGIPKQATTPQHKFKPYMKVEAKHDIKVTSLSENAAASVQAGFDLILVDM